MEGCLFTATSVYGLSCWLHVLYNKKNWTSVVCKHTSQNSFDIYITNKPAS